MRTIEGKVCFTVSNDHKRNIKVPPRIELGSLDSESRVLTIKPWDLIRFNNYEIVNSSTSKSCNETDK